MSKYLSVISNFGCHYSCPYCIVKNTDIDIPKTTVQGLDKLVENIEKYNCDWVSVSGGGDPLFHVVDNKNWWRRFFRKIPDEVNLELHTSYISDCDPGSYSVKYMFDRVVYHCHTIEDLYKIKRCRTNQIVRAVFVVTEDFNTYLIDKIAQTVKYKCPDIDELSFRQMVDSGYNATHYCEDYLREGHQKDWYYIDQCDYNIYYAENEVKMKFEDFRRE